MHFKPQTLQPTLAVPLFPYRVGCDITVMQWVYHRSEFSRNKLKESVLHTTIESRQPERQPVLWALHPPVSWHQRQLGPLDWCFTPAYGRSPMTQRKQAWNLLEATVCSLLSHSGLLRNIWAPRAPQTCSSVRSAEICGSQWNVSVAECAVMICLFCFYFGVQVQMCCREDLNTRGLSMACLKVQRRKSKLQMHVLWRLTGIMWTRH